MLNFVGNVFTQKMSVFVHFLYILNEKELNQQVCIKYAENEISNSTSHRKKKEKEREKEREEQKHIQLQKLQF